MKSKNVLPILVAFLILTVVLINFYFQETKGNKIFSETNIDKSKNYPNEWFDYQRIYPYATLNTENYLKAMKSALALTQKSTRTDINWELVGPTNIGGRISDIEIHPNTPNTLYVGGASGGILKSTDGGSSWTNIFNDIPTIGIGDMAIDPENENIIYAGTGESNASSNTFLGSGIYKSTDAGNSWTNIGLESTAYIGRIIVDKSNSENIFVAACGNLFSKNGNRGIYKSTNGGTDWEKILFLTDSTSAMDIVQHPSSPNTLYATMWERYRGLNYRRSFGETSGIWKTTDGGTTWSELTSGLPTGTDIGRIGITIAESNPNVLYAFYETETGARVYKTTNGGTSWTRTNDGALSGMNSTFGWYFGQIRVDPQDENRVFALGQSFYRTENGGTSWSESSGSMHVDHHAMIFVDNKIWDGNDGGLYYSTNNGSAWTKVNNLPLTQFYDIALDSLNSNRLLGGTQDNNSIQTTTGNDNDWQAVLGGDGMYCLIDYTNSNTYYCEYQWGGVYRFENGYETYIGFYGDRTNWSTPYILHPTNPNILYLGTYQVQKSTNKGDSWSAISGDLTQGGEGSYHTLTTIDVSKLDPNIIITGSADGRVNITTNDGASWTDITSGLPNRWITRVKADPFDVNTIYATVSGFRFDEAFSHIYKSTNLGLSWIAIDGNLPEIPVNVIIIDPDVAGTYYIGTDAGAFITEDGGENWESITSSLPNVPIMAMEFNHNTRMLYIGTFGLSAYKAHFPIPIQPNSLSSLENTNISIYPNPAKTSDNLNINFYSEKNQNIEISIINIKGSIIYSATKNVNSGDNNIVIPTLNNISKGLILCKIKVENKLYTSKIIVE